jgi:hypothetical protein
VGHDPYPHDDGFAGSVSVAAVRPEPVDSQVDKRLPMGTAATAIASINVDLPVPLSPVRNVTAGSSSS